LSVERDHPRVVRRIRSRDRVVVDAMLRSAGPCVRPTSWNFWKRRQSRGWITEGEVNLARRIGSGADTDRHLEQCTAIGRRR